MLLRFAAIQDSPALLEIYAQYIHTPITFECTLPTASAFADRISGILPAYPYLVCEDNGRLLGYAYAHRQMERAAYQWNAELSIYLDPSHTSQGLGKKMYLALLDLLTLQGIRTVYGGVTVPNEKSQRLHTSLGFSCLGIYHHTGYKCGRWHDVAWYEKALAPYDADPASPRPIRAIPEAERAAVLSKYL